MQEQVEDLLAGVEEVGGSSSGHVSHSSSSSKSNSNYNIIDVIAFYILGVGISSFSVILFRMKIIKAKIHSRHLMRMLSNKDEAWKYKNVQKQVEKAYFIIQKAWTEQNINQAKEYLDKELFENFQSKIEWMQIRREKNILKKISLIDASPILINDRKNDEKDYVWYYIRGSMIDYTINIDTMEKVDGRKFKTRFTEYWKFIRKDNDKWVLCKILQEDEKEQIFI